MWDHWRAADDTLTHLKCDSTKISYQQHNSAIAVKQHYCITIVIAYDKCKHKNKTSKKYNITTSHFILTVTKVTYPLCVVYVLGIICYKLCVVYWIERFNVTI